MAGAATTTTSLAGLMKTYYDRLFLEMLVPNLRYDQLGVQKNLPQHEGKTILWNRYTNLSSGYALTEFTVPGLSAMSTSTVSATLAEYGYVIGISKMFNMTAISQPVKDAITLLTDSAALTIDQYIVEEIGFGSAASTGIANAASATRPSARSQGFPLLSNSTVYWGTTALANNMFSTSLSVGRVRDAVTQLRRMNAKPFEDGYFVGVIHPVIADKIMADTTWASWNQYLNSKETMWKGEIGRVQGVRFLDSTNAMKQTVLASSYSAGASDFSAGGYIYGTLIVGKGAYGVTKMYAGDGAEISVVDFKADKSDPLGQYGTAGYSIMIAAKVLNPSAGIIVGDFIQ